MLLRRAAPLVAVLTLPRASPALATACGSPRHPRQRSRQHCARRRSLASAPLVCRLVSQLASCSSLAAPLPTFMPYVVSCRSAYLAPLAIAQTSLSLAPLSPRAIAARCSPRLITNASYRLRTARCRTSPCHSLAAPHRSLLAAAVGLDVPLPYNRTRRCTCQLPTQIAASVLLAAAHRRAIRFCCAAPQFAHGRCCGLDVPLPYNRTRRCTCQLPTQIAAIVLLMLPHAL